MSMRPFVAVHPIACAALAAAACTPMQWVKPEAMPQQLSQDAAYCQQEAWREARFRVWLYRPNGPTTMQDAQGRRSFVRPAAPFGDSFRDQLMGGARLVDFCLRTEGL